MTTDYHTPLSAGDPADADIINAPLAELDAAITAKKEVVWTQATESASDDTDAPSLPERELTTDAGNMIVIRLPYQKVTGAGTLGVRGQYYVNSSGSGSPTVKLYNADTTDEDTFTPGTEDAWTDFDEDDLSQDISGLTNGQTYEFQIQLDTTGATKNIKVRRLQVIRQ